MGRPTKIVVAVLLVMASVVIMLGVDRRFYQVTVRLQVVVAAVRAIAFYPSRIGAIALPLIGFILVTRPDSLVYFAQKGRFYGPTAANRANFP